MCGLDIVILKRNYQINCFDEASKNKLLQITGGDPKL